MSSLTMLQQWPLHWVSAFVTYNCKVCFSVKLALILILTTVHLHLLLLLHYNYFTALWILPGTTWVSWNQKGKTKTIWISWSKRQWEAVGSTGPYAKSATRPRQLCQHPSTQFFYRPDALPATQPTMSKHWRKVHLHWNQAKAYKLNISTLFTNCLSQ